MLTESAGLGAGCDAYCRTYKALLCETGRNSRETSFVAATRPACGSIPESNFNIPQVSRCSGRRYIQRWRSAAMAPDRDYSLALTYCMHLVTCTCQQDLKHTLGDPEVSCVRSSTNRAKGCMMLKNVWQYFLQCVSGWAVAEARDSKRMWMWVLRNCLLRIGGSSTVLYMCTLLFTVRTSYSLGAFTTRHTKTGDAGTPKTPQVSLRLTPEQGPTLRHAADEFHSCCEFAHAYVRDTYDTCLDTCLHLKCLQGIEHLQTATCS